MTWTIKVWWSDGRVTTHDARSRSEALDIVSGNAHPFDWYELSSKDNASHSAASGSFTAEELRQLLEDVLITQREYDDALTQRHTVARRRTKRAAVIGGSRTPNSVAR